MALPYELTGELKCYDISGQALVVKEGDGLTICKLKAPDSKFSTVRVLVDAANLPMLKVKKKHLSVHNEWIAFDCDGTVHYNLLKKKFQKNTFICVCCSADFDMGGVLWPLGPPVDPSRATGLPALPVAPEVLPALPVAPEVLPALPVAPEVSLGAPLLMSSDGVAPVPSLYEISQENMTEYGMFEIEGSWSGKECAMRVKGSETIIAQMFPLDNNAEGFVVRVAPNINREFVATCFAAVYAMKSESRKRKNVVSAGGKVLGAALLASGKCIYDCAAGGC